MKQVDELIHEVDDEGSAAPGIWYKVIPYNDKPCNRYKVQRYSSELRVNTIDDIQDKEKLKTWLDNDMCECIRRRTLEPDMLTEPD